MPLHPPGADPARTMEEDLAQLATLDRLAHEWRPQAAWERSMVLLREQALSRLAA